MVVDRKQMEEPNHGCNLAHSIRRSLVSGQPISQNDPLPVQRVIDRDWCAKFSSPSLFGTRRHPYFVSGDAGWYADERNARLRRGKGQQLNKDWVRTLLTKRGAHHALTLFATRNLTQPLLMTTASRNYGVQSNSNFLVPASFIVLSSDPSNSLKWNLSSIGFPPGGPTAALPCSFPSSSSTSTLPPPPILPVPAMLHPP